MVFYCYFKISYAVILIASLAIMVQCHRAPVVIDGSACIGLYTKLGDNVIIEANAKIYDFVEIEPFTVIHKNSSIGKRTHIKERCTIGRNVAVGQNVEIGYKTTIADHSKVYNSVRIGEKCTIAPMVTIHDVARIGNNNTIEMGTIIAAFSEISNNVIIDEMVIVEKFAEVNAAYVGKHVYIGVDSKVGQNSIIGESAVIFESAALPSHVFVLPAEIVTRTPTSLYLYRQCRKYILSDNTTPEFNQVKTASFDQRCPRYATATEISPGFNFKIGQLIKNDLDTLNKQCIESKSHRSRPQNLQKIIGLYLVQYHGIEHMKRNLLEIDNELFLSSDNPVIVMLHEEQHFTDKSFKTILESDVIAKFIQLLIIDQDATRELRADGDLFCGMLHDIQNKQRNILFTDTDISSETGAFF